MNISQMIQEKRKEKGLSQEQLADRIYVSRQTISNWETGKSIPDLESVLLLSTLFDVSADEMIRGRRIEAKENGNQQPEKQAALHILYQSWIMAASMLMAIALFAAYMKTDQILFLFFAGVIYVFGFAISFSLEKLKKQNNLTTYREIDAFLEKGEKPKVRSRETWKSVLGKAGAAALAGIVFLWFFMLLF